VVWQIRTSGGEKPNGGLTVVSTLHLADGVQYRVVGRDVAQHPDTRPVLPSLEDGYVWLMQTAV
jgi:ABC-2 type transport system ATP-binding protein